MAYAVRKHKKHREQVAQSIRIEEEDSFKIHEIPRDHIDISLERLGEGSYGFVQRGTHEYFGDVAIKFSYSQQFEKDIVKEYRYLVQLGSQHTNFVRVFGIVKHERFSRGCVMELMEGGNLNKLISNRDISYDISHSLHWMRQVSSAVCHFHYHNIIHRDIKSLNLLLSKDFTTIKLCDLGLSREQAEEMTVTQGTGYWLAPETMEKQYTTKVDVYACAITLWELISRRRPYDHMRKNMNILLEMYSDRNMRPEKVDCEDEIWELIENCWMTNVEKRYSSEEMYREVNRMVKLHPWTCPPRSSSTRERQISTSSASSSDWESIDEGVEKAERVETEEDEKTVMKEESAEKAETAEEDMNTLMKTSKAESLSFEVESQTDVVNSADNESQTNIVQSADSETQTEHVEEEKEKKETGEEEETEEKEEKKEEEDEQKEEKKEEVVGEVTEESEEEEVGVNSTDDTPQPLRERIERETQTEEPDFGYDSQRNSQLIMDDHEEEEEELLVDQELGEFSQEELYRQIQNLIQTSEDSHYTNVTVKDLFQLLSLCQAYGRRYESISDTLQRDNPTEYLLDDRTEHQLVVLDSLHSILERVIVTESAQLYSTLRKEAPKSERRFWAAFLTAKFSLGKRTVPEINSMIQQEMELMMRDKLAHKNMEMESIFAKMLQLVEKLEAKSSNGLPIQGTLVIKEKM